MKIYLSNVAAREIEIKNGRTVHYVNHPIKNISGTVSQLLFAEIQDAQGNVIARFNNDVFAGVVYKD